jgi:hypothetical protein
MTIDDYKKRHPLSQWVMSKKQVNPGDKVVWYDYHAQNECEGFIADDNSILDEHTLAIDVGIPLLLKVDFFQNIVYNKDMHTSKAKPTASVNECRCESLDLFHYGCRCGYWYNMKK